MRTQHPLSLLSVCTTLTTALILGSCEGNVTEPLEDDTAPIQVVAYAVGVPLSTIVIEVTAADIPTPLVFNLILEGGVASGIVEVPIGEARTFTVTVFDDQDNLTHTGSVTTDVAPGDNPPVNVQLTPLVGEVEVVVTFGSYAVLVTPTSGTIDVGTTDELQLTVTVLDQNNEEVPDPAVQWATSRPAVATVDDQGLVTGVSNGFATIVATYAGVAGMSQLEVTGFAGPTPSLWTPMESGTVGPLLNVWGSSATDVYAVGTVVLHYEGTAWNVVEALPEGLQDIWGTSATDIYGLGGASVYRYDGGEWMEEFFLGGGVRAIWGSASDDIFVVGEEMGTQGIILHYDGTDWTDWTSDAGNPGPLRDVWGSSATDVFVVGDAGTILHYAAGEWLEESGETTENLNGVWASAADDVYAVGDNGTVLHYNGVAWSLEDAGHTWDLWAVWGSSSTDVFAPGAGNQISHYDGAGWTQQNIDFGPMAGIWGSSATDVFAVGGLWDDPVILHYSGS